MTAFDPADLLPVGQRVSPQAIADGYMREQKVIYQGQVRHVARVTKKGLDHLIATTGDQP